MTRRERQSLFYVLLCAFFLIGAAVVLYVNGWRFNPRTLDLMKVGAIYVRSYPIDAKIYLDGVQVENKSGFFQSGTLIGNLFPGNYKLKLALSGYKTWEENVRVLPSLVSETKYAVLVPETAGTAATGTIDNFWLLGDSVLLGDRKNNLSLNGKKIAAGVAEGWTSDFKNILTHNDPLGHYFLYNADTASSTDVSLLLKKIGFDAKQNFEVFMDSEDKRTLIVRQQNKLYALDLGGPKIANIYKTSLEFGEGIASSQFYYAWTEWSAAENTSTLVVYDKFLKRVRPKSPELHGKNLKLVWITGANKIGIFQNDNSLYTYDVSSGDLNKIADDVKNFAFTDGGDAVAALEHNSLEIFFFNQQDNNYYRFNVSGVEHAENTAPDSYQSQLFVSYPPENVVWYSDKNHLFMVYPDQIKFLDIQNASLDYFPTIAKGRLPQYDEKNNRLYFVTNDGLKTLDFPR